MDESLVDCVELGAAELPKRHVYNQVYREGTLREKLFGLGPRLPNEHPGATYRLAGLATTLLA